MSALQGVSPEVRAAIREAARRNAAKAPAPKDWQIAILAPLFNVTAHRKAA